MDQIKVIARSNVLGLQWGDEATVFLTDEVEILLGAGRLEQLETIPDTGGEGTVTPAPGEDETQATPESPAQVEADPVTAAAAPTAADPPSASVAVDTGPAAVPSG